MWVLHQGQPAPDRCGLKELSIMTYNQDKGGLRESLAMLPRLRNADTSCVPSTRCRTEEKIR